MGKDSEIGWTHHTFNPWWGCTKISQGCKNCYAAAFDKRVGGEHWGPDAPRRFFGDKHWLEPLKWNAEAVRAGERHRVFCASMADLFEELPDVRGERLDAERARLWDLIRQTTALDYLLLTKRPELFSGPADWGRGYLNVWLGTTAEDQSCLDERWEKLARIPAAVRFLSCEPLLSHLDLSRALHKGRCRAISPGDGRLHCGLPDDHEHPHNLLTPSSAPWFGEPRPVDWVIVGGESGPGHRPCDPAWITSIVEQCTEAGVPVFVKQDSGSRAGKQGRISDEIWARKEFPTVEVSR